MERLSTDLKRLCEKKGLHEALLFSHRLGFPPSTKVLSCLLQVCTVKKDIHMGRDIYSLSLKCGYRNVFLANQLIRMFAACGSLLEADEILEHLSQPNQFTWTTLISGHTDMGDSDHAIDLYHRMFAAAPVKDPVKPDSHLFVAVLKACTNTGNLTQGRLVHMHIRKSGFESHIHVTNSLITMYAKCGCLTDAYGLFAKMVHRDSVTWGAMVTAYLQHGQDTEALSCFLLMRKQSVTPNRVTFICVLKACSSNMHLLQGKCIHADITELGLESEPSLANSIVNMYVNCGSLHDARFVFNQLVKRSEVSWNVMVEAYDQEGNAEEAVRLYGQMQLEGIDPDRVNFLSILRVCVSAVSILQGKLVHHHIVHLGLHSDPMISNALIDLYAKCGTFSDAYDVFVNMPNREIVGWNTIISACVQTGECELAFKFFEDMKNEGLRPNYVTYASLLSLCSHVGHIDGSGCFNVLNQGKSAMSSSTDYQNCLVNLHGSLGQLKDAEDILQSMPERPNVVGCRTLLNQYRNHGALDQVQDCFLWK